MFLDFSCLFAKKWNEKKERSFDATSLFECPLLNIQRPIPSVRHPNPSPTHSSSTPSPAPHLLYIFFDRAVEWRRGRSVLLQAMVNHQGCVHLCALLWSLVTDDAPSRFLPISLCYHNGMEMLGGGGKDWQSGAVCLHMTNPGGRRVLVTGLLCPVTAGSLLRHWQRVWRCRLDPLPLQRTPAPPPDHPSNTPPPSKELHLTWNVTAIDCFATTPHHSSQGLCTPHQCKSLLVHMRCFM